MNKQSVKITLNNKDSVYFTDQAFNSSFLQAEEFIKRNKGNFKMDLYYKNLSPYLFKKESLWIYQGTY